MGQDGCDLVTCEGDLEYHFNPCACDSFCLCTNGVPYYQPCSDGYLFNPELEACDSPEDADCDWVPNPSCGKNFVDEQKIITLSKAR